MKLQSGLSRKFLKRIFDSLPPLVSAARCGPHPPRYASGCVSECSTIGLLGYCLHVPPRRVQFFLASKNVPCASINIKSINDVINSTFRKKISILDHKRLLIYVLRNVVSKLNRQ